MSTFDNLVRPNGSCIGCPCDDTSETPSCRPVFHGQDLIGKGSCDFCGAELFGHDIMNFWLYTFNRNLEQMR